MSGRPQTDHASDIPQEHWIDSLAPAWTRPYLRLARIDRPIGTWLLLLPCWWGLGLATAGHPALPVPSLWYIALFAVGALVMRGAGCTWNDITDRKFDAMVARTATRPIPSGQVTVTQAVVFMGLQMLIGLAVLLQFNDAARIVGVASLVLVFTYPFMKRITYWPQAFLGLTFNWGALVGWAAMSQGLHAPALVLYAAGIAWTLGYDTIYAHQDKEDDALIGVKSTALKLGAASRRWLVAFYTLTILLLAAAGALAGLGWAFYLLLIPAALQLAWQVRDVDLDDPADCLTKFKSNRLFGLIVFAAIVAGGFGW